MIRRYWPALLVAGLLLLLIVVWRIDRAAQYDIGYQQAQSDARALNIQIERATQEEADRADAQYRGAVLARETAQKAVAAQRARIDGLLEQLRRRPSAANAGGGPHDAGADWIGVLGRCVAEYERLGGDAARLADKVNGLQGYINSVRRSR